MTKRELQVEDAVPQAPRPANPRHIFWLMLPAGMFVATFLAPLMAPNYDSGDIASAGWLCMLGPLGLICGVAGFQESLRPGGSKALGNAVIWCALMVGGVLGAFWVIFHFDLLKPR